MVERGSYVKSVAGICEGGQVMTCEAWSAGW